jgi:predicted AAA+ superfamily ATPase
MIIIHSMNRLTFRPRALASVLERALADHPIVILAGARQTGKTTLVQHLPSAASRVFKTLDDIDVLEMARERPADLLAQGARLTLDEVQRAPEILLAVKRDVDQRRRRGRFLLTGSANLLLMREAADSLAGRAVYVHLMPFTGAESEGMGKVPPWSEVARARKPEDLVESFGAMPRLRRDWRRRCLVGGMPRAVLARSARERSGWFDGYLRTYLERDLRDLSDVASLPDFRRLMGLAVHRLGRLLNQTELGRDAGIAQATAHRYLNLLDVSFQTHRVPAMTARRSRRLIKSPKLYWTDTGVAAHLAGISSMRDLRSSGLESALLENLVLVGLTAWREMHRPRPELSYWRTTAGAEVDFVIEMGSRAVPVQVRTSRRARTDDLKELESFLDEHSDRAPLGVLLHDGEEPSVMTRRVAALPVSRFV